MCVLSILNYAKKPNKCFPEFNQANNEIFTEDVHDQFENTKQKLLKWLLKFQAKQVKKMQKQTCVLLLLSLS